MKKESLTRLILKKGLFYTFICFCTLGFASCSDDYDDTELRKDIDNLENRVTALEERQQSVNADIQSLKSLVAALENRNHITDVTTIVENGEETGYTLSFQTGKTITIKHGKNGTNGKDGATPSIGTYKDTDGIYYWTVNGSLLKDENGYKLPVTGEKGDQGNSGSNAIAPQVRINSASYIWQISTDGGKTWADMKDANGKAIKATGENGEKGENGDSFFKEVDYKSDPNNVTFTLTDGTQFSVPRLASTVTIDFEDGCDLFVVTSTHNKIQVAFTGLTSENYKALIAELKSEDGTNMDIVTKATAEPKVVEITDLNINEGKATASINKSDATEGSKAILKVTLIDNNGQEIAVSRIIQFCYNAIATAEDLVAFAQKVNDGTDSYSNKTVVLLNDIDLSSVNWTPIGQTSTQKMFKGTFDGNGYTIKNLTIDDDSDTNKTNGHALFGWLQGTVKNLTIDNASVKAHHNVGIIAGYTESGTIENCKVTNSIIEATHKDEDLCGDKVGGITGFVSMGYVKNCTVSNTTITAGRDAGYVVGCEEKKDHVVKCSASAVTLIKADNCTGKNMEGALIGRSL